MAEELNINEQTTEVTEEVTKTYTQAEVDELLQRETDRRVSSALKKQESKIREAEKVSRMNEQEKYEYQLKQREEAIAQKEKELALAENKAICSKILAEKGLSQDFVEYVVAEDASTMDANIKKIEKAFKSSVKAEIEKRIGSNAPKVSSTDSTALTKEGFRKMTLSEKQEMYNLDRELYNSMIGR